MDKTPKWEYAYRDSQKGMTFTDIAYKYNVSRATVYNWRKNYWPDYEQKRKKDNPSIKEQIYNMRRQVKSESIYTKYNLPKITDKEQAFVNEYIIDLNKQAAAIRAGYSVATAGQEGNKLYNKPSVNAHIQIALAERNKRTGISADIVIRELARIALSDASRAIDLETGAVNPNASVDDMHTIASIKVKKSIDKQGNPVIERETKLHDKVKALELLAKHIGMLNTTSTVNVNHSLDLSKLSTDELQKELDRQNLLAKTIDVKVIDSK